MYTPLTVHACTHHWLYMHVHCIYWIHTPTHLFPHAGLAFLVYRLVPLLPELRQVMDWVFTDTTLSLINWLKVQEIYAQLFLVKVQRERELVRGWCMVGVVWYRMKEISCVWADFYEIMGNIVTTSSSWNWILKFLVNSPSSICTGFPAFPWWEAVVVHQDLVRRIAIDGSCATNLGPSARYERHIQQWPIKWANGSQYQTNAVWIWGGCVGCVWVGVWSVGRHWRSVHVVSPVLMYLSPLISSSAAFGSYDSPPAISQCLQHHGVPEIQILVR